MAKTASSTKRVRLKPADPFELIRWLARSQSDPRKAVAELVQNALDAQATRVRVLRRSVRKQIVLSIEDNGEGVIPELGRAEALQYLATHVGHSRKRNLTPKERAEQVIAGQYGVGLLGFWAVGKRLELRSRVGGSELMALRLTEDSREAVITGVPLALDAPGTFTHVMITDLHDSASRSLSGKRLADYLAAELRGQLLSAKTELIVEDRLARGSKVFPVVPRAFVGEQLAVPRFLPIEGHPPARIELYFADTGEPDGISIACAGTLVADDIRDLPALGLAEAPWVGGGLTGMIDFAGFSIPPGSRRGVLPNAAAGAFAAAMADLAPLVTAEIEKRERETSAVKDRQIMRQLRRALRGLGARLPQYELPALASKEGGIRAAAPARAPQEQTAPVVSEPIPLAPELFPPGPLAAVSIQPKSLTLEPGKERRIRAVPVDATGRTISEGVTFAWTAHGPSPLPVTLSGSGRSVTVVASAGARPGESCHIHLEAVMDTVLAQASVEVTVAPPKDDSDEGPSGLGLMNPELVRDQGRPWRSRLSAGTWQINQAHEDYLAVRADAKARMRYLLALLAKEMVFQSYGRPGDEGILEHMVEILAHAERNLRGA